MTKEYRLSNGYGLSKIEIYNGFTMVTRWGVFDTRGQLVISFEGYQKAYEYAKHLVPEAN